LAQTKQAGREETDALLADEYLADLVYMALLERGEASKVSEITLEINNPRITFPVVRRAVTDSPRFVSVDRMWNLSARYLDRSRPTERNLLEVLQAAGRPLSLAQLASELSVIYDRDSDVYLQLLGRALRNESAYFKTAANEYGTTEWIPLVDGEEEEDVLFDNEVKPSDLAPFVEASQNAGWSPKDYAGATLRVVEAMGGRPVPHRLLGVLAWKALRGKYDARAHLLACFAEPGLVWLTSRSGGRWISQAQAERLEILLEARGAEMAGEDMTEEAAAPAATPVAVVVPDTPAAPQSDVAAEAATEEEAAPEAPAVVPAPAAEPVKPLEVSEADLAALEQIVSERGAAIDASELLALRYEVVPGDPSYRADVQVLTERLKQDERFAYVGAGRFREANALPLFVYSIPEFLTYPDLQFVSMDGEIMDEEIEDEGFAGSLRQDTQNPLAQDVGDDEGEYTGAEEYEPGSPIRLVLKMHHKEIGTFPLCQVPDGFFPDDAPVVEVVLRDPSGQAHEVVVNHELRLMFNLFGLYELIAPESGGVFLLHPTARPHEFRFEPVPENDPQVYVAPARLAELLALREQADEEESMATFDITCEVLAHYPKGLDFVELMTEVNIVRRVTRRKLASILSNYFCFLQKAGQPQWRFDVRKRDLGTDRAKRKYLKR
jgi:Predicted membrane protein